jgi:hypothetical protein
MGNTVFIVCALRSFRVRDNVWGLVSDVDQAIRTGSLTGDLHAWRPSLQGTSGQQTSTAERVLPKFAALSL